MADLATLVPPHGSLTDSDRSTGTSPAETRTKAIPAPPVVSVVIPCFNEAARIPSLVKALRRWNPPFRHAEVILVDDGSTDQTYDLLQQAATDLAGDIDLRIERLDRNRGKGAAVRHGIALAGGIYTVFLDADLSVGLDEIAATISHLDRTQADIAFGSRHHPHSTIPVEQPWRRQIGGRVMNLVARTLGLTTSRDTQCGFKVMRRQAATKLFPLVRDNRFAFDIELLHLADQMRYSVIEVPVTWSHHNGSTVRPIRDGIAMVAAMVSIRRRGRKL